MRSFRPTRDDSTAVAFFKNSLIITALIVTSPYWLAALATDELSQEISLYKRYRRKWPRSPPKHRPIKTLTTTNNDAAGLLSRLPLELRLRIYEHLLFSNQHVNLHLHVSKPRLTYTLGSHITAKNLNPPIPTKNPPTLTPFLPLLLTNRFLYSEVSKILYATSTFAVSNLSDLCIADAFIHTVPPAHLAAITRFRITIAIQPLPSRFPLSTMASTPTAAEGYYYLGTPIPKSDVSTILRTRRRELVYPHSPSSSSPSSFSPSPFPLRHRPAPDPWIRLLALLQTHMTGLQHLQIAFRSGADPYRVTTQTAPICVPLIVAEWVKPLLGFRGLRGLELGYEKAGWGNVDGEDRFVEGLEVLGEELRGRVCGGLGK